MPDKNRIEIYYEEKQYPDFITTTPSQVDEILNIFRPKITAEIQDKRC